MFTGVRTYENGSNEEEQFETYEDMVKWLAEDSDAGVAGYEDGEPVEQGPLSDDIQAS